MISGRAEAYQYTVFTHVLPCNTGGFQIYASEVWRTRDFVHHLYMLTWESLVIYT